METRDAFMVVGMTVRTKPPSGEENAIPALWGQFCTRMGDIRNSDGSRTAFGVMDNFDCDTGEFDYVAGMPVLSDSDVPDGMVCRHVPAQTYAVFDCSLPSIGDTFRQIYKSWLPNSGYSRSDGPEFEFYPNDFNPDEGKCDLTIWIPIVTG